MRCDGEWWSPDTLMLPLTTFSKFFLNFFLSGFNPPPIPWSRYLSKLSIVITGLSTWNGWVFGIVMITIVYLIGPDGWGCWPSLRHRLPPSPQPPTPLLLHPLLPAKPLQDVTKWRSVTISSPPLCPTILLILKMFFSIKSSFWRSWSLWTPLESGWCIQGLRFHVWFKEIWKS